MSGAIEHPSPNHGDRRGMAPDLVVIHYTAMETAEAALERLCDPAFEVSAHYLVAEDGRLWRLVDDTRRAWHAGAGAWAGATDVNSRSLGVELANPGDAPFPLPQMRALEALLDALAARWRIPPERVIGHACMAPERKRDPGPRFDWRALGLGGRAIWLDPPTPARDGRGVAEPGATQAAARRAGYAAPETGLWDAPTLALAAAFRARFRPWEREEPAPLTPAGLAHLEAIARRWPAQAATGLRA